MPLSKSFISASIRKLHETCYILEIKYSWYWLAQYSEVFVFPSLQEAKDKLLAERTHDHVKIDVTA